MKRPLQTARLIRAFACVSFWFLICGYLAAAETKLPPLYPFLDGGKWGYLDPNGSWVISPRYDRCIEVFTGKRVRAWQNGRWGYIDRAGEWIVPPRFDEPCLGSEEDAFEIVCRKKKQGILDRSGVLLLPTDYDEIVLLADRAWVRTEAKLGLFAFDGHWILPPSIPWPAARAMPIPTESGVSWFTRRDKWGLLSTEGKILFSAQFSGHVMGRREAEEWDHPEGVDFKNGRAWVVIGEEYCLITAEGRILSRQPFEDVKPWSDDLFIFTDQNHQKGIISKEGRILLKARFSEIRPLVEDHAVVVEMKTQIKPDGEPDVFWQYGYIDKSGNILVEPGTYASTGELEPFSEGRAPVAASPPGDRWDPYAGYIDETGAVIIPLQYLDTMSFSEGLAAVQEAKRTPQLSPRSGLWGYVDREGKIVISPQFGGATPFFRDRAWVLKEGCYPDQPYWAMIDRTGKVLTDFSYEPPERRAGWRYSEEKTPEKCRWRGELAILTRFDFHNGLATADGNVLVPPVFNHIGEFHDGVAVATDTREKDEKGNVKFVTSLITSEGKILATGIYTAIGEFDYGVAWASRRTPDEHHVFQQEGWGLIDTAAQQVCELKYVAAHWVWGKGDRYTGDLRPTFYGDLAPVASVSDYQRYGEKVWDLNDWGYIDRQGKIVAWHDKP